MSEPLLDLNVHVEAIVHLDTDAVVARELLLRPVGGGDLRGCAAVAEVDMAWVTGFALQSAGIVIERDPTPLHVNITPEDLARPGFADTVRTAMDAASIAGLVLEITEQTELRPSPQLRHTLVTLRRLGVRFAIDDFGDGWAGSESISLVHPEIIKVRLGRLLDAADPGGLAQGLARLATRHHAQVVVEQIETSDDVQAVRAFGFRLAQGWFWGPGWDFLAPRREP